MIVTTLDTFTSLISGITIFGVLGNLAYELNYDDVSQVIGSGGASLAFISYPDAIAKSPFVPQVCKSFYCFYFYGHGITVLSVNLYLPIHINKIEMSFCYFKVGNCVLSSAFANLNNTTTQTNEFQNFVCLSFCLSGLFFLTADPIL